MDNVVTCTIEVVVLDYKKTMKLFEWISIGLAITHGTLDKAQFNSKGYLKYKKEQWWKTKSNIISRSQEWTDDLYWVCPWRECNKYRGQKKFLQENFPIAGIKFKIVNVYK